MATNKPKSPDAKEVTGKELGRSGVQIYSGIISMEEYNRKLVGLRGLKIWDEMRRGDASTGVSLRVVKLPIQQADWDVVPASDDPADVKIAAEVKHDLWELVGWQSKIPEILTHLEFGFSLFEMVLEPKDIDGKLRIALTKLGYRKPTTIYKWNAGEVIDANSNVSREVPGVTQMLPTGEQIEIPEAKLVRFTNQQEGDNFEGISLLRPAYKHWYMKEKYYLMDAVGFERHALGIIDIEYPSNASQPDRDALKKMAREARVNESSYVEHPVGYKVSIMDMKSGGLKSPKDAIDHHDRQITKNVLAQFLELGASGASGARATSEDHSRLFELAEQALANYICERMQKVIKTLVDLNHTVTAYPKLVTGKIGDDRLAEISEAVSKFVTSKAITTRREDENYFRRLVGMAELSDDELEDLKQKEEEQAKLPPVVPPSTPPAEDEKTKASIVLDEARRLHASLTKQLYGQTDAA